MELDVTPDPDDDRPTVRIPVPLPGTRIVVEGLPAPVRPYYEDPDYQDWLNELGERMPDSWDDDVAMEDIVLRYVRTLEARCDAAGISREPEPS